MAAMRQALPPASAALLGGLLLGERTDLPAEIRDAFRTAGVYHVLAVSGFNVALLATAAPASAGSLRKYSVDDAAITPTTLSGATRLVDELEAVEKTHAGLCPLPASSEPLRLTIHRWTTETRTRVSQSASPSASVETLNRFFFEQLAISSSQDLHDPCNLLPTTVLERKQGYCVGLAALYLALAQELDLPIFAVATPSHVFLRYDDGTTRINIETTALGTSRTDESYVREGKIPEASLRKGVFLHNLSTDEFLAQVHNNLGVIYSERKDYVAAGREYEKALDLNRYLPAASYNWGNDLLTSGDYPRAATAFTRSLRLYPTDVWALNNRGVAYRKLGKPEKARRDFEEALSIDPGFEQARENLEGLPDPP
jgi:regulator of sirC expression with transglutaminase-like and TPR domain